MGVVLPFRIEATDNDISADRVLEIIRTVDTAAWPLLANAAKNPSSAVHEAIKRCGGIEAVRRLFTEPEGKKKKWRQKRDAWASLNQFLQDKLDEHEFMCMAGTSAVLFHVLKCAARGNPCYFGVFCPASDEERARMLGLEERVVLHRPEALRAKQEQEQQRKTIDQERSRADKASRRARDQEAADALVAEAGKLKGTRFQRFVAKLAENQDRSSRLATQSLGQDVVDAALAWVEADRQKAKAQREARKARQAKEAEAEGKEAAPPASRHLEIERCKDGFLISYVVPDILTLGSPARAREVLYRVGSRLTSRLAQSKQVKDGSITAVVAHAGYRKLVEAVAAIDEELDRFSQESLTPQMVEEALGINARERLKWTKDGRLPTSGTASFYKGNNEIVYALHPADRMLEISKRGLVAVWRTRDKEKSKAARKRGAKKAAKTRVANETKRKSVRDEVDTMAREAARQVGSPLAVPLVKLALLTTMCSRWAKRRQELDDQEGKEKFYSLKDRALRIMVQQPWTSVKFLQGHRPRLDVHLCDRHREEFRDERYYYDYNFWDWVEANGKDIRKCGSCSYSENRDYYSLYDIEMVVGDASFSWHVPYSLGREWLPPRSKLEALPPARDDFEGAFLFGRPVNDLEEVLWPANRLEKEIGILLQLFERKPVDGDASERAAAI